MSLLRHWPAFLILLLALGCSVREVSPALSGGARNTSKRLSDITRLPKPKVAPEPGSPPDTIPVSSKPISLLPSQAPPPAATLPATPVTPVTPNEGASATANGSDNPASATLTLELSPSLPTSPSPQASSTPQPTPTPTPAPSATPSPSLQQLVEARLGTIARISFEQGQANLVSNNAGNLLGNNGGQLLSDQAGSLLSDRPGSYRLAQAAPVISLSPLQNEYIRVRRNWDTGGGRLLFHRSDLPSNDYDRRVEIDEEGRPWQQDVATVESRHGATGPIAVVRFERLELGPDGSLRLERPLREHKDPTGMVEKIVFGPGTTRIRMPERGVDLDIERFELDLDTATGAFTYRFRRTGNTEVGTLSQVARDANGVLWYSYGDALGYYAGTSEVRDATGTLVVRKTRELEGGSVFRSYDLGDGLVMRLLRGVNNVFRGPLNAEGVKVADVGLGIFGDGTTIFDLAYVDNPGTPRRVGWGVPPQAPAPTPTPRPAWRVETVAGAESGMADGSGAVARFRNLRTLVASQQVAGRYFACDLGNHRIIRLDRGAGGWTSTTVAGNGSEGDTDGAGNAARFRSPLGLAIAADDTLYVSELSGHRIRRIRQTNTSPTVDTIAGAGVPGLLDGMGATVRFNAPSGLALVGDMLYIAEQGNHTLRRLNVDSPDFPVSTVIGDGIAGDADGPAATVRLRQPVALARAADDSIWLAESMVGRIRRYDAVSGQVSTIVAAAPEANGWLDGPPGQCGLFRPFGLLPAGERGTLVSHVDIRAIAADGTVRTITGQALQQGASDGDHRSASFVAVWGMALMEDGSYILTDSSRIRRLIPPVP